MKGTSERADVVVREVEVIPNGREQNLVFNGNLENSVQHELKFPANFDCRSEQNFRPALSRADEPGGGGHGQHSAHAGWLF